MPAAPKTAPEEASKHETLAQALVAFQAEMPTVGKGSTAEIETRGGGSYSYKYTDLADLTKVIVPLLVKHGLAFTVQPRMTEQGYEVKGVLLHESGQKIKGALPLYGRQPQEIGGALTYARRYLLGCLTGVVTDEDNDAQHTTETARTSAKDWDEVVFRASTFTDPDELMGFWQAEAIGQAPVEIQNKVKAIGAELRKQKELDEIAERENAEAKAAAEKAEAEAKAAES